MVMPSPLAPAIYTMPSLPQTTSFSINLVCKEGQDGEVALHFNPRLEESIVVFNTMQEGRWGREERGQGIPFQRGQPFDVLIITTEDGFKVCLPRRDGCRDPGPSAVGGRPLVELAKAGRLSPVRRPPLVQPH